MFIKELNLYVDYLQADIQVHLKSITEKKRKQLDKFKIQLHEGIIYYKQLFAAYPNQTAELLQTWFDELTIAENKINNVLI